MDPNEPVIDPTLKCISHCVITWVFDKLALSLMYFWLYEEIGHVVSDGGHPHILHAGNTDTDRLAKLGCFRDSDIV